MEVQQKLSPEAAIRALAASKLSTRDNCLFLFTHLGFARLNFVENVNITSQKQKTTMPRVRVSMATDRAH